MINLSLDDLSLDSIAEGARFVKYVLALVIILFLILTGYWIIIQPNLDKYNGLLTQTNILKTEFETKQQQAANLTAYKKQLTQMRKAFDVLLGQVSAKNEMSALLEDISKTGTECGLTFDLFQPTAEIKQDFYVELPINMIVIGTYHQLAVFVSRITKMNRMITWHDFDITVKNRFGDLLEMKILAKIYQYRA